MEISLAMLPALIHVYIFVLESLRWGKASTNRVFGVKAEDVETCRPWAFNQGFYNLFLALSVFIGLALRTGDVTRALGTGFVLSGLLSMIGAGLVLILSNRKLWRAALIQALPALISIYSFLI